MKRATDSLRFRFIASTFALILSGLIVTGLLMTWLMKIYVAQGYHDEMQVHIEEVAALVRLDATGQPYMIRNVSDPRFQVKNSGFYWEIRRDGFQAIRSPSLTKGDLSGVVAATPKPQWKILADPTGQALEYGMTRTALTGGPPLRISISSDMRLLDDNLKDFTTPLIWALSGFALLFLAAGAAQIAYGLRPLIRLAKGIADIREGRSTAMVGSYPTEVTPLVEDINALLVTNAGMVQRARLQAGNLAHGLRTPLAILIDEADHLDRVGQSKSATALRRECDRMQRQISYNLARARSAAALPVAGRRISIEATLQPLLTALPRLHAARNVTINVTNCPDAAVVCDDVDLGEILSNLIDNACKWAGSVVNIAWHKNSKSVQMTIEDDGPGIPEANRIDALQPWKRLDDSTPGTGLGLAIALDLLQVHNGTLDLGRSALGGLRATLTLPAEEASQDKMVA
jgi:signal transduction histidine kinase